MKFLLSSFALLLICSCSDSEQTIDDFAGDWESPPMSELFFDIGLEEQIEDLRDGTHPLAGKLASPELDEMLSLPMEDAKAKFKESGLFGMMAQALEERDPRFGFTIAPPDRLALYLAIDGERQVQEYDAEFELTSEEIICRHEDGPTVFTISGDLLITDNEREGYPTKLPLHRAENGPNEASLPSPDRSESK